MKRLSGLRLPSLPTAPRLGLIPRIVAALVVVALVAGAYAFWPRQDTVHVTGEFSRAVGLFPGSDVRILGVQVGRVTQVTPRGDKVEVAFEFDRKYKVPADAKAAVVAPSLVSDRYVQLLPAYTAGPVMQDNARIGLDRTAVPVELDRISTSLNDLLVALGPTGANKHGAFADVLHTGAANLGGQGQKLHDTNRDLSLALATLSGGRDDLFGTVKNLQTFTTMLATNDSQVRRLNGDLASVSQQLEGERGDLAAALANLAVALSEVSTFVRDNRAGLTTNLRQLASVTGTVARQRDALAEALTNAPVAVSNLQNAYNHTTGTLDTRANINENLTLQNMLCSLIVQGGQPESLCKTVSGALKPIASLLNQLQGLGVKLPLNLLSALPQSQATSVGQSGQSGQSDPGVVMGGADPTLGGLLGGSR
ncbi:phospholipid/cholesterol/gamma-HCH transport system substrate-binding protein [Phycicoccus badiiscoriae]|uniref:Phospholipid/cholesterol/gamma-HCH transport system substrate-binding protein n=1 Tax=Pedococcus badiiscoriae TaxID=642776 RepID=A0A852WJB0_9MICO|nr:MCE family protein [Pedococcus badiiscoriae]NYG06355.1 phospholipid/cholesterol/gamma-HCH transport system substrate-binding protein [Pedococcus badiiscoriae]